MIRTLQHTLHRTRTRIVGVKTPTPVRPDDALEAHASGPDPIRVLLAGGDILTGWGVRTHNLAIPGHLARILAEHTGRGVDVTMVLHPTVTSRTLLPLLLPHRVDTFDAVILHLGLSDVQRCTSPTRWATGVQASIANLRQRLRPDATITIVGIPEPSRVPYLHAPRNGTLDTHAATLNHATQTLCNATDILFLPAPVYTPPTEPGAHVGRPDHYLHWARHETDHLAARIQSHKQKLDEELKAVPCPTTDTARRMRALHNLNWTADTDAVITRIVQQAYALFEVDTVTFAVATTDELVHYIHTGGNVKNVPLDGSLCWKTMQHTDTRIVNDIRTENPDFDKYPARFYAGHPVFAPDGTPIGTLCLLATRPPADDIDCVLLHDMTQHIQQALA